MISHYWSILWELIRTPFGAVNMIWAVVPLYFGWLLNEITSSKTTFNTAIQSSFSFLWAGAQWSWLFFSHPQSHRHVKSLLVVNAFVTLAVLTMGVIALWGGIRRRYPPYCSFLGHTRFSNYFMIAIFPIQSNFLTWSWERLAAIAFFAPFVWIVLRFGLAPFQIRR